jgi:hypothetical protein
MEYELNLERLIPAELLENQLNCIGNDSAGTSGDVASAGEA